jgi:hypothetical protein
VPQQPIDPDAYQQSLERIGEIFGAMMLTVDDLVGHRCPYKNRFDQCTAGFGCRNQRKARQPGQLKICGGDDKLDYRSAWQDG